MWIITLELPRGRDHSLYLQGNATSLRISGVFCHLNLFNTVWKACWPLKIKIIFRQQFHQNQFCITSLKKCVIILLHLEWLLSKRTKNLTDSLESIEKTNRTAQLMGRQISIAVVNTEGPSKN